MKYPVNVDYLHSTTPCVLCMCRSIRSLLKVRGQSLNSSASSQHLWSECSVWSALNVWALHSWHDVHVSHHTDWSIYPLCMCSGDVKDTAQSQNPVIKNVNKSAKDLTNIVTVNHGTLAKKIKGNCSFYVITVNQLIFYVFKNCE